MPIDSKPQIIKRVEALEGRYTDTGLNTETFPISDAVNSDRSDIAASSKAVKTAYDEGTRYATTTQQGQVILIHDVGSKARDKALTPFGVKTALDELEKNLIDRLDSIENSLNERIEQIIKDIENKFNELSIKIDGRLPLFDMKQRLYNSPFPNHDKIFAPDSGSLWLYHGSIKHTHTENNGAHEGPTVTTTTSSVFGFAQGGELIYQVPSSSFDDKYEVYITAWRVFA